MEEIGEIIGKLHNKIGDFTCYRCGRKGHIPYPPKEKQKEWHVFSWTAFLAMYIKWHLHWTILKGWRGEYICPDCHKPDDDIDDSKLSCTDDWIENYNKWKDNKEGQ